MLLGHVLVQRMTSRRERRSLLRTAYADFAAASFEYLDAYVLNLRHQEYAINEMYAHPDNQVDWYEYNVGDKTMTLQKSYALLRDSKARVNVARCRVLLLEPDPVFRGKLNHVHECLVEYTCMRLGDAANTAFRSSDREGKAGIMQRDLTDFLMAVPGREDLRG